jgi:hypothetical protein
VLTVENLVIASIHREFVAGCSCLRSRGHVSRCYANCDQKVSSAELGFDVLLKYIDGYLLHALS